MRRFLIIAALGVLCASLTATLVSAQTRGQRGAQAQYPNVEIVGGDEESLRELLLRLAAPYYPGNPPTETTILVEALPESLPFEIPMPGEAQVIGSIVQGEPYGIQVIAEFELGPEETIEFYKEELGGDDWRFIETPMPMGGFVSSEHFSAAFCYHEDEADLMLSAVELGAESTEVRMYIQLEPLYSICNQRSEDEFVDPYGERIPVLDAPETRVVSSGGGSTGPYDRTVSATVETELGSEELLEHYIEQMEEAGWELVDEGSGEGVAWSTWTMTDEDENEWGGVLIVAQNPVEEGQRFAWLDVVRKR